mmetsp:Transcript_19240/g.60376  ORF Transcript_19240/g.60376 Transcript_19240/m.60376 type:complete len:170 (-) Transcript_19240:73-582(-)
MRESSCVVSSTMRKAFSHSGSAVSSSASAAAAAAAEAEDETADPEWEKAFRIVDETTHELSRILAAARTAPRPQRRYLLARRQLLLSSSHYAAALRYLEDPVAERERRCAGRHDEASFEKVLFDVPIEPCLPAEPEEDGLELLQLCCAARELPHRSPEQAQHQEHHYRL